MANPVNTPRTDPSSATVQRLPDGHSTLIAFNRAPNLKIWEVEVTPPGLDGGDEINITTMHNVRWRTMISRALITLTPASVVCAYDPDAYNAILDFLLNQEGSITCQFPDGSDLDFFGFLKRFTPNSHKEGEMPTAAAEIVPTNYDPANRVEAGPILTSVAGT